MLDRKGIVSFLLITFTVTYLIEGVLIASGFSLEGLPPMYGQLVIAGVMWAPALGTVLTIKFVTKEGWEITNLRFGSWKPYVSAALLMPVIFAVIYGLSWLLGFGEPDWQLVNFVDTIKAAGGEAPSDFNPTQVLVALFLASIVIGPTINGIFGFGEEYGWRGYLLPKLMPLGRVRAYLIVGVIWGLWHAPLVLVGFNYPGYPVLGVFMMMAFTTAAGIYINEMTLRHRSSILAGSIHGALNGQAYGIWGILFPTMNPLLGGVAGLVGVAVWSAVGIWTARRPWTGDEETPPL
jgi:membrane protease YdiL (CAAX protease family)